jgi:hypothetical protein
MVTPKTPFPKSSRFQALPAQRQSSWALSRIWSSLGADIASLLVGDRVKRLRCSRGSDLTARVESIAENGESQAGGRINRTPPPGTSSIPDDRNTYAAFSIDPPLPASPSSMRLTVLSDKSAFSANFCCVQSRSSLPSLICALDMHCAEMLIVMGPVASWNLLNDAMERFTRSKEQSTWPKLAGWKPSTF